MTSIHDAFRAHRPYLVNLGYQMLGDVGEAEDMASEAFVRLARTDLDTIDDVRGWLTVVTGRLCLDQLRSARHRREKLWWTTEEDQSDGADPADRVTLDDEVRSALLAVLRQLSPAERVAFVLHDVFGMPFEEIAEMVGRPVGTYRQLARRARRKVRDIPRPGDAEPGSDEHRRVTEAFLTACANGDLPALIEVLAPQVWGVGTVLVDPPLPPQVNHGRRDVAVNLLRYLGGVTVLTGPAGQPVLLAYARRRLFAVVVLTVDGGRVTQIEATADPSALGSP
jgi:RNA polymerase sigma-70 factor, ECF subfamily